MLRQVSVLSAQVTVVPQVQVQLQQSQGGCVHVGGGLGKAGMANRVCVEVQGSGLSWVRKAAARSNQGAA